MHWRNDKNQFGLVAKLLHWLSALGIYFVFGLGVYMTGLDYYDPWYHTGPFIHKSLGLILLFVTVLRFIWRQYTPPPKAIADSTFERSIALWVQRSFYFLLFVIFISGYLISTAKGSGISVFDWFEIPAVIAIEDDRIGEVHELVAFVLIGLTLVHISAALLHHFKYKDNTLKRIIK